MRWTLWPDRIGARLSIVLIAALAAEFIGSEIVYRYSEAHSTFQTHVDQLAGQLVVADRLLSALPAEVRDAEARQLWRGVLDLSWVQDTRLVAQADADTKKLRTALGEDPLLDERRILLPAQAENTMSGALQLSDGSWIEFRRSIDPDRISSMLNHLGLTLVIVTAVAGAGLMLLRLLDKPLQETIKVIDSIDFGKPVPIEAKGPRELQRMAQAINAMQQRLLDLLNDRVQALAAVSHDLRTPIARLRLRAGSVDDPELRGAIDHDLNEMEAFINTVLDHLREDEVEAPCLADIASLVQTVVDDAHDLGADATYDGPARLEAVTRPVKLGRVVTNLVQNALRHAGQARVSLAQTENGICITVEDDGPGIPPDQIEEVFRPFHRLESSRNRHTGGAGLGLSIVKRSTDRLGGTVSIENRAEGGLRAKVTLNM